MGAPADPLAAFRLDGRVAVVTGAGSGIGATTAEYLAAVGAAVVVADRDDLGGQRTVAAIAAAGGEATFARVDVSHCADVNACVSHALERYGQLDVMANVAGIPGDGMLVDLTEADLDHVLGVNLKGVVFGCQAAVRAMTPRRSGSIVNVASAAIDHPAPGGSAYAMSKAGVAMLTMCLAVEVGADGIRVNAIAPGVTLTNFSMRHMDTGDGIDPARLEAQLERFRGMSPLGLVGGPEDQASLIVYLASDAARFCTGAIFRANGGVGIVW